MLYRPGNDKSQEIWGYKMDTLIVNSLQEEIAAMKSGWFIEPALAIKRAKFIAKRMSAWNFYLRNWQWFWGTLIGVIVAIFMS